MTFSYSLTGNISLLICLLLYPSVMLYTLFFFQKGFAHSLLHFSRIYFIFRYIMYGKYYPLGYYTYEYVGNVMVVSSFQAEIIYYLQKYFIEHCGL